MIWLEIDPNVVKPGWTPLILTVVLGLIIVGLFFSMRKQFRRIDVSQAQPGTAVAVEGDIEDSASPTPEPTDDTEPTEKTRPTEPTDETEKSAPTSTA